jgi:hypothetical protein
MQSSEPTTEFRQDLWHHLPAELQVHILLMVERMQHEEKFRPVLERLLTVTWRLKMDVDRFDNTENEKHWYAGYNGCTYVNATRGMTIYGCTTNPKAWMLSYYLNENMRKIQWKDGFRKRKLFKQYLHLKTINEED